MRSFLASLLLFATAASAQSLFRLDVLARDDAPRTVLVEPYGELVSHLDAALNARFILRLMPNRELLESSLRGQTQPHFVITDGVVDLPAESYIVLHQSRDLLTAVLLVEYASPLRTIADLNGKSVLANPKHAVAQLAQRLGRRTGSDFAAGGGRHHNERELAAHFAQFGGRDALLTSLTTAEKLIAQHPNKYRLLPESESAPRWVLAGRRSLAPEVNAGLIAVLRDTPEDFSLAAQRLLPAAWTPRGRPPAISGASIGR